MITRVLVRLLFYLLGGDTMAIVTVYVTLIIASRRDFAQIPASLKPAVEAELTALGLGTDGQPLQGE